MTSKQVLFVDQEEFFLNSIKRYFRFMRNEWTIHLASTPSAAMQKAAEVPIDVLISGMMFSGQSGVDLLRDIRDRHPQIVRLLLSGHSDHNLILKSVDLVHQFISKPCENKEIVTAIKRAFLVSAHPNIAKIGGGIWGKNTLK